MAALLLVLVFLDTAMTGYLLGQYRYIKRTVRGFARSRRDVPLTDSEDLD